jgi:flagellar P-ring protein precursor FlgI
MLEAMLKRFGAHPSKLDDTQDVAAATVTADAMLCGAGAAKPGTVDVKLQGIGDAKSLNGGMLLVSPLLGPDGKSYAYAQGRILSCAFNKFEHSTTGCIPSGAVAYSSSPSAASSVTEERVVQGTPAQMPSKARDKSPRSE